MSYVYVAATILLTVYAQLVLKWQIGIAAPSGLDPAQRGAFLLALLANPWIWSGAAAGFGAALCWMLALAKLQLTYAYPFVSLSFVLVLIMGFLLLGESLSWAKAIGVALIIAGVTVSSQG